MPLADDPSAPDDTAPNDDGSRPLHPPYNLQNLPRPTRLAVLSEFSDRHLQQYIDASLQSYSNLLERPTTPEETNAIAYYCAKRFAIGSWGLSIGQAAGAYRWYSTWNTYRFPFYQPDVKTMGIPYKIFGYPVRPLVGQIFWHGSRLVTYGAMGGWFGKMLFTSYAVSTTAVAQAKDERLEEVREAALKRAAKTQREREMHAKHLDKPPPPGGLEPEMEEDKPEETKDKSGEGLDSGDQMLSDEEMRRQNRARPPYSNRSTSPSRRSGSEFDRGTRKLSRPSEEPSLPPADDFIAPEEQKPEANVSAWERLRKNAANQPSSSSNSAWAKRRGEKSATEDGETDPFGFENGDDERKKSKEDAQREFDEALERERRQR